MSLTLTVGFTYYNEKEMLTQAILSLALQGTDDLEILVYDDAAAWPADDYLPEGIAVRVIRGEANRGPGYGRNVLLRESAAQYIHFHDSDDLFLPDWKAQVRKVLDMHQPDAVFTEIRSSREGVVQSNQVMGIEELASHGDLTRFCIERVMLVPAGTYRREFLLEVGGYDETVRQSEDFDFHLRLSLMSPKYKLITTSLVEIRQRPDSRSTRRIEVFRDGIRILERVSRVLTPSYRTYVADALLKYSRNLYRLDDIEGARNGFELAKRLGPPDYRGQPAHYRRAARIFGLLGAERIAKAYKNLNALRCRIKKISTPE